MPFYSKHKTVRCGIIIYVSVLHLYWESQYSYQRLARVRDLYEKVYLLHITYQKTYRKLTLPTFIELCTQMLKTEQYF